MGFNYYLPGINSVRSLPALSDKQIFPGESLPRTVFIGGPPGKKPEVSCPGLWQKAFY